MYKSETPSPATSDDLSRRLQEQRARQPVKRTRTGSPAPVTPPLPSSLIRVSPTHTFMLPVRRIMTQNDLQIFLSSDTCSLLTGFIFAMSESVRGQPRSSVNTSNLPPTLTAILSVLHRIDKLMDQYPAQTTASRFGNPAFREFYTAFSAPSFQHDLANIIPNLPQNAVDELAVYLTNCLGDPGRLDYGSGHELNFFVWLLCLYRLGLLDLSCHTSSDTSKSISTNDSSQLISSVPPPMYNHDILRAIGLCIFPCYLALARRAQRTYYLEPAGSQGVWGLDDYQFVPFLLGSSQLIGHTYLRPRAIHQHLLVEESAPEYIYMDQIMFVNESKNVEGLRWHSPLLDDISAARSWEKIESGMRKMFLRTLLGKLPVMQHFLFGSLIPVPHGVSSTKPLPDDIDPSHKSCESNPLSPQVSHNHLHDHDYSGWGDPCGIRVPSGIAAVQELRKRTGGDLRRIPFD